MKKIKQTPVLRNRATNLAERYSPALITEHEYRLAATLTMISDNNHKPADRRTIEV